VSRTDWFFNLKFHAQQPSTQPLEPLYTEAKSYYTELVRRTNVDEDTEANRMRALTVRQPWAWAIIHAGKDIENRGWTNRHVAGTIAIHAGSGLDPLDELPRGAKTPRSDDLVRGAIIGVVDIVGVVKRHRSKWFSGPLGWLLQNPRPLPKPIRYSGRLGLWRIPPAIERTIAQQLGARRSNFARRRARFARRSR
jgi:hypothetical protein